MKTLYTVVVREGIRAERLITSQTVATSSMPYAVKLVTDNARRKLPRGWKRLWVEVGR